MNRIIVTLILFVVFTGHSDGQNYNNEYSTIYYKNSIIGGLVIHTNGLGTSLQYLNTKTAKKNYIVNLDIISLKHPKETKILNAIYDDAKPYVFGKLNSVILLRPGLGNQFIIADKENPIGVRVNTNFVAGASIALLKPVYLYIYNENLIPKAVRYDTLLHRDQGDIKGGAPYYKGFSEISSMLGFFIKYSFSFEWNNRDNQIKTLELGIIADYFPNSLPIFAYIENKDLYFNFYANLYLGKRW